MLKVLFKQSWCWSSLTLCVKFYNLKVFLLSPVGDSPTHQNALIIMLSKAALQAVQTLYQLDTDLDSLPHSICKQTCTSFLFAKALCLFVYLSPETLICSQWVVIATEQINTLLLLSYEIAISPIWKQIKNWWKKTKLIFNSLWRKNLTLADSWSVMCCCCCWSDLSSCVGVSWDTC